MLRCKLGKTCSTAAVVYALLLAYVTLAPDPWWFLGQPGKKVEAAVDRTFADFIQHGGAYLVLAVLFCQASSTAGRRGTLLCGSFVLLHAVGTEWLQCYIPLRTCDWRDAGANLFGIICGWLGTLGMIRFRLRSRRVC